MEIRRKDILTRQSVPGTSPFRKSTWEAVGGFDLELSYGNQDWDFWMGVVAKEIPWQHVPDVIYLYRTRENSMCRSYGLRWPHIVEYMYRKHRDFFEQYGIEGEFLAQGYRRGAFAAQREGARRKAAFWAWKAIRYGDVSRAMLSILLRSVLGA